MSTRAEPFTHADVCALGALYQARSALEGAIREIRKGSPLSAGAFVRSLSDCVADATELLPQVDVPAQGRLFPPRAVAS